jgi:hypothetical protein
MIHHFPIISPDMGEGKSNIRNSIREKEIHREWEVGVRVVVVDNPPHAFVEHGKECS